MYQQRLNYPVLAKSIERGYVTTILGPRRVGKSYFVKNYIRQYPHRKWIFLNMDNLAERNRVKNLQLPAMIIEAAKQHIGVGEKIWVVIDEAQKCPELFEQIKIIYDEYKDQDKIKFIITGSAVLSLHQLSAESLAGRIELHHLQEFNLRESVLLHENKIPINSLFDLLNDELHETQLIDYLHHLLPFRKVLEQMLTEQLLWGGFPELLMTTTVSEKLTYLNNYLQTYLEKDVRAIETITDLNLYRNLLDILAEQAGSIRDEQRITSALGCTRDTLKKYRGYVEATLLYIDVYPYIGTTLKRLVKSPKGYLLNNGLVALLTGILDLNVLLKTGLIGHRLENWFLNELNTWIARTPLPQQINYWRTSTGIEVDFVVIKKPHVFPFEITYSTEIQAKKVRNLQAFLQNEPKASWGYYLYRGDFAIDHDKKILFLPCWAVA